MAYVYPNRNGFSRQPWKLQRGLIFGIILVAALAAFELFNYATTEYALSTLLGGAQVIGVNWASVLAIAFCAIDFAGLARLFTPEQGRDEPKEVWYLLGAWFLGATMNAVMTWWAVTNALLSRPLGNEIVTRQTLLTVVPVFVAALVWLTRILIIGTFGTAGERLFTLGASQGRLFGSFRPRSQASIPAPRRPAPAFAPQPRMNNYNWSGYGAQRAASASPSTPPPAPEAEELTYEPVDEEQPTAVPNWPRSTYQPGRARPAPKPGPAYSNVYSMRAYGREIQPYVNRQIAPRTYDPASAGEQPDDTRTRFYR